MAQGRASPGPGRDGPGERSAAQVAAAVALLAGGAATLAAPFTGPPGTAVALAAPWSVARALLPILALALVRCRPAEASSAACFGLAAGQAVAAGWLDGPLDGAFGFLSLVPVLLLAFSGLALRGGAEPASPRPAVTLARLSGAALLVLALAAGPHLTRLLLVLSPGGAP